MLTAQQVWVRVLAVLKEHMSQVNYRTWFTHTTLHEREGGSFVLSVPSAYTKGVVVKRFLPLIQRILGEVVGEQRALLVDVDTQARVKKKMHMDTEPLFVLESPSTPTRGKAQLREDFTFETFAVSTSNQLAHAAAVAASRMPGKAYNPLFIYGGVGVGKSHIMHAVGNAIAAATPSAAVVYGTGEEFTNELIVAIQTKTTNQFKRKYRESDCLLVDDIQFIAGKTSVQEEFFHTFNAVLRSKRQIILTSDRPPAEIDRLEVRLTSRFEAGMIVDVQPPDFELRTAILLIKAQNLGVFLPMSCAQIIAQKAEDIRRMEGMLTRLTAVATFEHIPISEELARRLFGAPSEAPNVSRTIQPKAVLEQVANHYQLKVSQLRGAKRDRIIVRPRQIVMYLLHEDLGLPLVEIGRLLGDRDHTTVLHGSDLIEKLVTIDPAIAADISGIRKELWG